MKIPYQNFSNYILRTPLLDFGFYKRLTSEDVVSDQQLKQAYCNPIIKEAIFLASPTVYFELEKWLNEELDPKKIKKIKNSLLKYLTRLSTRCTPFGIFAGCALGDFTADTQIIAAKPESAQRHTRLDMNYLVALSQDLSKKKELRDQLLFYPNSSLYQSGNQLRYIEYYYMQSRRQHHIVEIDNSVYLENVLNLAQQGLQLYELAKSLIAMDISLDQAKAFVEELIENQVLISELEPSISGPEFEDQLLEVLDRLPGTNEETSLLKNIREQLAHLDLQLGNKPEKYLKVSELLANNPTSFELKYLFQTDMQLMPKRNKLSASVAASIQKGLTLLNRITPPEQESNLKQFKEAFLERYEDREMPLAQVLDVETGIGYIQHKGSGDVNPLVDDLILPGETDTYAHTKLSSNQIDEILLKKLIVCDQQNSQKIVLKDDDFEQFPIHWDDLPDTMSTMIKLVDDDGKEKIKFTFATGSSAANLLGRFCHGDSKIHEFTNQITALEQRMNPDKILAEIVHLPEARVGNIIMRPSLRNYEIPYLARSLAYGKHQVSISDLYVSIRNNRIYLWSKKLNKEVLPRLSNAHNFSFNALPIYQFLADLQGSDLRRGLFFGFGTAEKGRDFLPRVEYNNLILHEAKWTIKKRNIQPLLKVIDHASNLKKEVVKFRKQHRIPKYASLIDG